jgi:hypothetical protein
LWGLLARRVYQGGRQFENVHQLSNAIEQEWKELDVMCMQKLIAGMHRRLLKVLDKRGGQIGY